jgi:hypothetical protein
MSNLNMSVISWDTPTEIRVDAEIELFHPFTEDPLLISCTLYRLVSENPESNTYRCLGLTEHQDKIIAKITDQDRIFAEIVRSYYKSKLLVAKLRGQNFSKFKNDLESYLNTVSDKISNKYVGLIYKLPYFYEYDMKLSEIFEGEYKSIDKDYLTKDHVRSTVELSFIGKADNGQKKSRNYEYWFKDQFDNRVRLLLEKTNPIISLWEHTLKAGNISIDSRFVVKQRDNLEFYAANGWHVSV